MVEKAREVDEILAEEFEIVQEPLLRRVEKS